MITLLTRFLVCSSMPDKAILTLAVCSIGLPALAQHHPASGSPDAVRDSLMLERYVQQALENNPRIQDLFNQYYARLEQIPQVGTLPDPEVVFQYHINPMESSSALSRTTVSAMQMFPWFGTLARNKEYVQNVAMSEWTAFEQARNDLVLQIKTWWYRMHELRHHLDVYRLNLNLLDQLARQVQVRYESGRASQVDLLRIQLEQENLTTQVENAEEKLSAMKVRFNTLLNRNPQAQIELPKVLYSMQRPKNTENLQQVVQNRNPELRGQEYETEAALTAIDQARLEGLPSFGLGVMVMNPDYMYMTLMDTDQPAWSASLTISIPLYRSKYKAQKKEARIQVRAARERQQDIANRLTAETEEWLQQYRDARRRVILYEERLIPKARQALDVAMADYSANRSGFEQVIQLQQQLLDYEMNLNTAYVEQNIAAAEMEFLYGKYNVNPEDF